VTTFSPDAVGAAVDLVQLLTGEQHAQFYRHTISYEQIDGLVPPVLDHALAAVDACLVAGLAEQTGQSAAEVLAMVAASLAAKAEPDTGVDDLMSNAGRRVDAVRTCCGLVLAADRGDRDGFDTLVTAYGAWSNDLVIGLAGIGAITLALDAQHHAITTRADRAHHYDILLDLVAQVLLGDPGG
jgi:hypothetical protein